MNTFQWLSLSFLGLLIAWDALLLVRGAGSRRASLFRLAVWLAAGFAIALPDLTTHVASVVGIGRGADAVLYFFVLAFLVTSFYFYARYVRLQRQVTELVRHIAIQEARRGGSPA